MNKKLNASLGTNPGLNKLFSLEYDHVGVNTFRPGDHRVAGKFTSLFCGAIVQVAKDSEAVSGPAAERKTKKQRNRLARKEEEKPFPHSCGSLRLRRHGSLSIS